MAGYLVTGGAGFIGSHLVEELLKRGQRVRVLDNFTTGKRERLEPHLDKIELVEGDLRSQHTVRDAVAGIDFVLHQGALPSVPRSVKDPVTTNEVNVGGTLNVLDAAREAGVKRVVYASSSSVYGANTAIPRLPLVTTTPAERVCFNTFRPARSNRVVSSPMVIPSACSISNSLGVQAVRPR